MSPGLSINYSQYEVITPVFTGPLDLLLQLIERAELDITRLALAQVTDQYLDTIHHLPETTPDEISAFLVIAARLLQIKSEALLPRPPIREPGEDDPGDSLARQLIIYKRFKQIADILAAKEAAGYKTFARLVPAVKNEAAVDFGDITLSDMLDIARWLLTVERNLPELATVVPMPVVTIREKIYRIKEYLRSHSRGTFDALVNNRDFRLDVVVTFLALLELVKQHLVLASQDRLFGPIGFEPADAWNDEFLLDLEFGE